MDRFIADHKLNCHQRQKHLKSNMDRFIVSTAVLMKTIVSNLKSNMDRFIEISDLVIDKVTLI